ncbi:MAG TPA: metallophosphoesterase [Solirubrobacterales bacterium]|nr:metallophosphoesterase [Solirubrobacterales bacterium]
MSATAIVSDLHLGSAFGEDLLRDAGIRRLLLEEIAAADRLVLLGDVLELRELPLPRVLEAARPFFEELGEAMAGRPVVLVPGNHDHRLAEPLLEQAALTARPLGLEQHAPPEAEAATRIATWLGAAELDIAYPGLWLRDDVYATHGHYMDCHMTLPRLECLAAATVMRAFGPLPDPAGPADYERVLRPVYGLSFSLAQAGLARRATRPSERAWRAMSSRNRARGRARRAALRAAVGAGVPATVWSLNRLLRADFDAELSPAAITHSGIAAATEMAARLGLRDCHTITGHTHRAGPGEGDGEWPLAGGGHLHNTGSWVFASAFHHPGTPPGPYWPGTVTWVEDGAPPRRVRLLVERPRDELKAAVGRLAASAP